MANTIILKQSSVASKIPNSSDITLGELALNTSDGKVYMKKGDNSIVEIGAGGDGGSDLLTINNQTVGQYTPTLSDSNSYIRMNNSSPNNIEIPLFTNVAFPIGTQIHIRQAGTGQTQFTGDILINGPTGFTFKLNGKGSTATIVLVSVDVWDLFGDLEAV